MPPGKGWSDVPVDIKLKIIDNLDIKSSVRMGMCSHADKKLVESRKQPIDRVVLVQMETAATLSILSKGIQEQWQTSFYKKCRKDVDKVLYVFVEILKRSKVGVLDFLTPFFDVEEDDEEWGGSSYVGPDAILFAIESLPPISVSKLRVMPPIGGLEEPLEGRLRHAEYELIAKCDENLKHIVLDQFNKNMAVFPEIMDFLKLPQVTAAEIVEFRDCGSTCNYFAGGHEAVYFLIQQFLDTNAKVGMKRFIEMCPRNYDLMATKFAGRIIENGHKKLRIRMDDDSKEMLLKQNGNTLELSVVLKNANPCEIYMENQTKKWTDIPFEVKRMVVDKLDLVAVVRLASCSKSEQLLVDSRKQQFDSVNLTYRNGLINFFADGPSDHLVHDSGTECTGGINHPIDKISKVFAAVAKYGKIKELLLTSAMKASPEQRRFINAINKFETLRVNSFKSCIRGNRLTEFALIEKCDPKTLEEVYFSNFNSQLKTFPNFLDFVELPQFTAAKNVKFENQLIWYKKFSKWPAAVLHLLQQWIETDAEAGKKWDLEMCLGAVDSFVEYFGDRIVTKAPRFLRLRLDENKHITLDQSHCHFKISVIPGNEPIEDMSERPLHEHGYAIVDDSDSEKSEDEEQENDGDEEDDNSDSSDDSNVDPRELILMGLIRALGIQLPHGL